ncbi:MAG: hypothetical protein C0412_02470 [Flavobacterium sp.]|nr:hypothetical protein [Flavobacterium sp.]
MVSCTQTVLILRNFPSEKDGHLLFGKNNQRNVYVAKTISDSLKFRWEASTHGSYNNSSVTVYDKYVITHDLSGYIYYNDFDSGTELGVLKTSGSVYAAPLIYKSRMFYITNDFEEKYSTANYYDLKDGKTLAQVELNGSYTNQLLMNGSAFYAVSDNGVICKFNFAGLNEWLFETKMKVLSTPAMTEGKIFFATVDGEFASFDIAKKEILYKKKIGRGVFSGVAIDGSTAYTGDVNGGVYSINTKDGSVIWKADTKNKIMSLPVFDEKYLYVTNVAGLISCYEKNQGKLKWQVKVSGAPIATPLLVNNFLIQPNMNSHLYLINKSDGSIQKDIKFAGRMKLNPVLYDNLIIFGFDKGYIQAFEITEVK